MFIAVFIQLWEQRQKKRTPPMLFSTTDLLFLMLWFISSAL